MADDIDLPPLPKKTDSIDLPPLPKKTEVATAIDLPPIKTQIATPREPTVSETVAEEKSIPGLLARAGKRYDPENFEYRIADGHVQSKAKSSGQGDMGKFIKDFSARRAALTPQQMEENLKRNIPAALAGAGKTVIGWAQAPAMWVGAADYERELAKTQQSLDEYVKNATSPAIGTIGEAAPYVLGGEALGLVRGGIGLAGEAIENAPLVGKYATQAGEYLAPKIARTGEAISNTVGNMIPESVKKGYRFLYGKTPKAAEVAEGVLGAEEAAAATQNLNKMELALNGFKEGGAYAAKETAKGTITGTTIGAFGGLIAPRSEVTKKQRADARWNDFVYGLETGPFFGAAVGALGAVPETFKKAWSSMDLSEQKAAVEQAQKIIDFQKKEVNKIIESGKATKKKEQTKALAEKTASQFRVEPLETQAKALEQVQNSVKDRLAGRAPRDEGQVIPLDKLSEKQRAVYDRLKNESETALANVDRLKAETIRKNPQRQEQLADQFAKLQHIDQELSELQHGVVKGTEESIFGMLPPDLSPENRLQLRENLETLSTKANETVDTVINRQEQAAAERDSGVKSGQTFQKELLPKRKEIQETLRTDSGLADIFENNKEKNIPANDVIALIDATMPTTADEVLKTALRRAKDNLTDIKSGARKVGEGKRAEYFVTPELMDSVQRVMGDSASSGLIGMAGTAQKTGGQRAAELLKVAKAARGAIQKEISEYEVAREKYAQLAEAKDVYRKGNIFGDLTETEFGDLTEADIAAGKKPKFTMAPKDAMEQIVSLANAGKEGLAEAAQANPKLKDAAKAYFNDLIFGSPETKAVTGEAMVKKIADNEKALKDLGLYDEYSQMARERQLAENQIKLISEAQSDVLKTYTLASGQQQLEKGAVSKATEVAKRAGEEIAIVKEKAAAPQQTINEKTAEIAKLGNAQRDLTKIETDLNDPVLSPEQVAKLSETSIEQFRTKFPELMSDEAYKEVSYRLSKATAELKRTGDRLKFAQDVRYFLVSRFLGGLSAGTGIGFGGYGAYKLFGGSGHGFGSGQGE